MHAFKDSQGEMWELDLTIGAVKRVLAYCQIDLRWPTQPYWPAGADRTDPQQAVALSAQLGADVLCLFDVIYAICRPVAEARGLGEEPFAERLGPEAVQAAYDAFFAEWQGFFRRSGNAPAAAFLEKQTRFVKTAIEMAQKEWANGKVSQALDRIAQGELAKIGAQLTSWPESAESTPTDSPCEP